MKTIKSIGYEIADTIVFQNVSKSVLCQNIKDSITAHSIEKGARIFPSCIYAVSKNDFELSAFNSTCEYTLSTEWNEDHTQGAITIVRNNYGIETR